MPSFYDQLDSMSEDKLAEYERVADSFTAAGRMKEGPDQEAAMDAIYQDAKALDSVMLMAGARCYQVISLFSRDEYSQGLQYFVPTMDLVAERGDEIPDSIRAALETLVVAPLDAMMDDPAIPRTTIEAYLDQLAVASRARPAAATNHALARAIWYSHTGERPLFEDWFDRWVTSGSDWWRPNKTTSIIITSAMLAAFDPQEALDHLERRTPTMIGDADDRRVLLVNMACWTSVCGRSDRAWEQYRRILAETDRSDFAELVDRGSARALVRAAEAAPWDSTDDTVSAARSLIEAAEDALATDTCDVIEDAAALARYHLLRGDAATSARWRTFAEERAGVYDARNGTDHWSTVLATRWFHDL